MDENYTEQNENPESQEVQEELSKTEALSGVFLEPGKTFETINKVSKSYWVIPLLIAIALGLVSTFMFFSDKELTDKVIDKQIQKVREQMEEKVKDGKMTPEQSTEAMEKTEKFMRGGIFFKLIGYVGSVISNVMLLFLLSLVYFVFLKIMKSQFNYLNLLNVIGLALMISGIGGLINVVISIVTGNLSSVSLGLLLSESTIGAELHGFITKFDVFEIWFYVLISIGLVKIGKIKPIASYLVVFAVWILFHVVTVFVFKSY